MMIFTLFCGSLLFQQELPATWDSVFTQLKALPQMAGQVAKAQQLEAEQGQLKATYQPQLEGQALFTSTNNPVGVFSGRLGNGAFRMEDFGIPQPDGTFNTYPVNNPDPYSNALVDLTLGYRLYDGGERSAMRRELEGMGQALNLRTRQVWQDLLGEYATRRIQLEIVANQAAKAEAVVQDTSAVVAKLTALLDERQVPQLSLSMAETSLAQAQAQWEGLKAQQRAVTRSLQVWLEISGSNLPLPPPLDLTAVATAAHQGQTFGEKASAEMTLALEHRTGRVRDRWQPAIDGFASLESHQLSSQNWTVGIQAKWKLWDGGSDKHLQAKYRAEAAEARAGQDAVARMMTQARTELREHLLAAHTQIVALEKAVTTARASWETHQALLAEGQLDQGTVFEVRAMLLDTEAQLIAAKGQAQILAWKTLAATSANLESYLKGVQ